MPSHGISIHMTAVVSRQNAPKFLEAFRPVYENVTAEAECTFLQVYQCPDDPGTISWVENWSKSKEWLLENQVTKAYYDEYRAITTPMLLKPLEVKIWNRLGPEYMMFKRENGGLRE